MARAGFGEAKLGTEFKKIGKPGQGHNYIRVIPPMGNSASNPVGWYAFHSTIWGMNGKHPSDPGKTIPRPIHSIEVSTKANGITQHDPLADWINDHRNATEAYVQAYMLKSGLTGDAGKKEAEKALEQTDEEYKNRIAWERRFNIEKRVYVNVMFKDRSFGAYKINFRDHLSGIKAEAKKLEGKEILAFDLDQGVWFDIYRAGNGVIPPDKVEVQLEDLVVDYQGKKMTVQNIVLAPLTEDESNQALKELPDLLTLGGDILTYDQMVALRDCSGDPDEVDAIFGGPVGSKKASTTVISHGQQGGVTAGVVTMPSSVINSRPEIVTSQSVPEAQATEASIQPKVEVKTVDPAVAARLASIKAKKEAEIAAAAKKAKEDAEKAAAEVPAVDPSGMTDDQFLLTFGPGAS